MQLFKAEFSKTKKKNDGNDKTKPSDWDAAFSNNGEWVMGTGHGLCSFSWAYYKYHEYKDTQINFILSFHDLENFYYCVINKT